MGFDRKKTRQIHIGNILIGGGAPVSVQSMTNTKTQDTKSTVDQIRALAEAGCDIVRLAVPDMDSAENLGNIIKQSPVPLVADIHFDYRLALEAIHQGIAALRLNPGNIGGEESVRKVVTEAKAAGIPIRIGVNGGSLDKKLLGKFGHVTAEALVESAMEHVRILEAQDFYDMKISLKAHDVPLTLAAYRLMSQTVDYPLHLGITEAGTTFSGTIKSSIGLGVLLREGIGDTIRVSLSDDPIEEIPVCKEILKNCNLYKNSPKLISCPTCGRIQYDLIPIAKEMEKFLQTLEADITVAIMGCAVNGPGEAREADIGIAGGKNEGLLFKKGEIIRKIPQEEIVETLKREILKMIK